MNIHKLAYLIMDIHITAVTPHRQVCIAQSHLVAAFHIMNHHVFVHIATAMYLMADYDKFHMIK